MTLNKESVGIIFSGGGTKGLAHAGALQLLEELQIIPTKIAATSAGSIIACMYAWGMKPEEILEFFKTIDFFSWRHFTFRKAGFIDSNSFKSYFENIFQQATIGDLNIDTYITATDIVRGKLRIFDKNIKITDAILASCAFPGVMSPYEINNNLYADGGILNHFPSDLLQGRCETLIGVYVSPNQNIEATDITSIKSVMSRSLDLMMDYMNQNKFSLCDILIQPEELALYGTFESKKHKMQLIYDIGYEAAKESLANINI